MLGNYELKSSDDPNFKNKYTYLIINNDDTIKLKTISQNGIVASKISRTGTLKFIKNNNKIFNNNNNNEISMKIIYNNLNKYSYSIFGIEIPEFRYEQISNYKSLKNIRIIHKFNSLYVLDKDSNYYYLFDSSLNQKLPYKDITIATLIITEVIGFLLNFIMLKIITK